MKKKPDSPHKTFNLDNGVITLIEQASSINAMKQERRPIVINNLARIIKEGRNSDAEVIAKNQSIILGVPAMTLILEAFEKSKGGVDAQTRILTDH